MYCDGVVRYTLYSQETREVHRNLTALEAGRIVLTADDYVLDSVFEIAAGKAIATFKELTRYPGRHLEMWLLIMMIRGIRCAFGTSDQGCGIDVGRS